MAKIEIDGHRGPGAKLRVTPARFVLFALWLMLIAVSPVGLAAGANFDAGVTAFRAGNYDGARRNWAPLAEAGQPQAQFNLALLYSNGLGVARTPNTARRWFTAAADQGNVQAQYNLALMLQLGDGVERDIAAARRWYEQAARQGLASAQNNLGLMYLEGQGLPADPARAIRWLKRAAENSAEARNNLDGLAARLPKAHVNVGRVNLRAGPSKRSRILDQVRPGDSGRLLDQRRGWSQLWFPERDALGWIADRLLDIEKALPSTPAPAKVDTLSRPPNATSDDDAPAAGERISARSDTGSAPAEPEVEVKTEPEPPPGRWYKIATASAELRVAASSDARVLQRLSYGTAVEVLERKPGWRQVRLNSGGDEGWIGAFVLTPDAEAEAKAAAAAEARRRAAAVGSGGG